MAQSEETPIDLIEVQQMNFGQPGEIMIGLHGANYELGTMLSPKMSDKAYFKALNRIILARNMVAAKGASNDS